jgi:hypothetical protein
MGFTDGHPCMFSLDMKQTPENVRKVLDISGWTPEEAAEAIDVATSNIEAAATGEHPLLKREWQDLLDKAGRRAFDWDGDSV